MADTAGNRVKRRVTTGIDDIRLGRIASFAEIAEREAQGERHIRLLAPLALNNVVPRAEVRSNNRKNGILKSFTR